MQETPISPSELIINPQGRIYHLDLAPHEMGSWIITVGDPDRVPLVSKHFDHIRLQRQHRELVTHTGRLGNKDISVISTGMGTDNIDIVLQELDALVNVDFDRRTIKGARTTLSILRLGTAGGLQADVPLDSWVVSEFAIGMDALMHFYDYPKSPEVQSLESTFYEFIRPTPLAFYGSEGFPIFTQSLEKLGCLSGITLTSPGFYGPQGRKLRLPLQYPHWLDNLRSFQFQQAKFLNLEMETAGLLALGKALGHRCSSVSAIVAQRKEQTFSSKATDTVARMIEKTLEWVADYSEM